MNIVGKDGYRVPGLDLPPGTLVKWVREKSWYDDALRKQQNVTLVRHTEKPIPEKWWDIEVDETKSFMTVREYRELSDGPVELEPFYTKFVTVQVPE